MGVSAPDAGASGTPPAPRALPWGQVVGVPGGKLPSLTCPPMTTRLLLRLALLLLLTVQVWWVFHAFGDRPFVYALDDPYIHLTLARNLATTGLVGVNSGEWSSASSAPAWTVLLAGLYLLAGDQLLAPLVLNLAVAAGLIWWLTGFLLQRGYSPLVTLVLGLAFVFMVPVIPLAFTGMEHLLHLALVVALVLTCLAAVEQRTSLVWPLLLAAAATTVRYESLFVIAGLALFCLLQRRWALGLGLAAAGLAVVAAFGAVNVAHGESLLPNTFLVKALSAGPGHSLVAAKLGAFVSNVRQALALAMFLVIVGGVLFLRRHRASRSLTLPLGAFVVAGLLQLLLASVGWFYRYEAYLIGLGVVLLAKVYAPGPSPPAAAPAPARPPSIPAALALLALSLALGFTFAERLTALREVPVARDEIYRQHYQMARFVHAYYNSATVALNDIGAVSYYTQARLVDLVGLGCYPIAAARSQGRMTPALLDQTARSQGARIALVYTNWLRGDWPEGWRLVGTWTTPDAGVAVGGEQIGFYALEEDPATLRRHLQQFAPTLPPGVEINLLP